MNRDSGFELSKAHGKDRPWMALWKRTALAVIATALIIGLSGCSFDDLLTPFVGDIPFEQEQTMPPEMGALDNAPTVPDDSAFDDFDFRPF